MLAWASCKFLFSFLFFLFFLELMTDSQVPYSYT